MTRVTKIAAHWPRVDPAILNQAANTPKQMRWTFRFQCLICQLYLWWSDRDKRFRHDEPGIDPDERRIR
jgi:hypothetical protein